ncbi:zinc knuckle CX2CX4HX4C containing protein [Tanacetum coccineum]
MKASSHKNNQNTIPPIQNLYGISLMIRVGGVAITRKKDVGKVGTGSNVQHKNLGDVLSSLGGLTIEEVNAFGNKDSQEGNVGQCSAIAASNKVSHKPVTKYVRSDATISVDVSSEAQNVIGLTINVVPSSYANKLSPKPSTKANLQKLEANVPNGTNYDVWLPLNSVYEVNDRMKNSLYEYFIGKRLAFLIVEWCVRNNWEKYGLEKVTPVKGFFFFKLAYIEGVESVLYNCPWMIRGIPILLNKWSSSDDVDLVDYDGVNEGVNNEDIEDEDVEIELDDDAELIFPYEVEGDKTPPPGGVSSNSEPPSNDEGTERSRKKSNKSSFDGTKGPSEPRGPPSDS